MKTEIISINDIAINTEIIASIKNGEPIAFSTETVYGLGTPISCENGISRIFDIKIRDNKKPLSAHISDLEQLKLLFDEFPKGFERLCQAFLPGPLAIILKKSKNISNSVTCGFDTLSFRFPSDLTCQNLINIVGEPLFATSANISGNASPINAEEVYKELNGRIKFIVDGGETQYKRESTIIAIINNNIKLLRQGVIPFEKIESAFCE